MTRVLLLFLMLVLGSGITPLWAADLDSISVSSKNKHYFVRSSATLNAPVEAVYETLIDFDNYERISGVYDDARWLERNADDSGEIYTYTNGCILFVCRGFARTESVIATRPTYIETRVDPTRSKAHYGVSVWNIEAVGGRTRVEFSLDLKPDFWVPPVVGPFVIKRYLRKGGIDALNRIEALAVQRVATTNTPSAP